MKFEKINEEMKLHFSVSPKAKKRYIHSLGVVDMALKINEANHLGLNEEDLKIAGILHDYLKAYSIDEQIELLKKYSDELELINYPSIIHSHVASLILKNKYNLSDEILNAIKYHTTGRPNMSNMEKVIFVSDAVEINRDYDDVEYYRNLALKDLDRALFEILEWTIKDLKENNKPVYTDTINAYEYYKKELKYEE